MKLTKTVKLVANKYLKQPRPSIAYCKKKCLFDISQVLHIRIHECIETFYASIYFQPEEDEWKEIEEEQSRDYTGLKIGQLTIADDESDGFGEEGEGSNQEGENGTTHSGQKKGVWKAGSAGAGSEAQPKLVEPVSKVYVSPAIKVSSLHIVSENNNK